MTSVHRADARAGAPRIVIIVLATAVFAGASSMRILDALLPEVAKYYGRSVGTVGFAVTAYALSYSSCQLLYGPLGDRMGPYRIITVAAILSGLAAFGCAFAPTIDWLVALRFLGGGVAAAIGPLTLAWISDTTTAQDRPVTIARITGASIFGTTAGQAGGGFIGQLFNWQASFLFVAMLFALSGLVMAATGARHAHLRSLGRRETSESGFPQAIFRSLLRRSVVRLTLFAVGLEALAMYMSFTYIAALLQGRLALNMATTAALIGFFGVGGIAFVISARHLVRRLTEGGRAMAGGGLLAIAFLMLMLVSSPVIAAFALFILGLGFFILHNILQVRATRMAPDAPGTALSLFAATFFLSQAAGAMIGGWLFDHLGASISCGASAAILAALGLAIGQIADKRE